MVVCSVTQDNVDAAQSKQWESSRLLSKWRGRNRHHQSIFDWRTLESCRLLNSPVSSFFLLPCTHHLPPSSRPRCLMDPRRPEMIGDGRNSTTSSAHARLTKGRPIAQPNDAILVKIRYALPRRIIDDVQASRRLCTISLVSPFVFLGKTTKCLQLPI